MGTRYGFASAGGVKFDMPGAMLAWADYKIFRHNFLSACSCRLKLKGREPNTLSVEAPRSAHAKK